MGHIKYITLSKMRNKTNVAVDIGVQHIVYLSFKPEYDEKAALARAVIVSIEEGM